MNKRLECRIMLWKNYICELSFVKSIWATLHPWGSHQGGVHQGLLPYGTPLCTHPIAISRAFARALISTFNFFGNRPSNESLRYCNVQMSQKLTRKPGIIWSSHDGLTNLECRMNVCGVCVCKRPRVCQLFHGLRQFSITLTSIFPI